MISRKGLFFFFSFFFYLPVYPFLISALLLHSQPDSLKCRSAALLKCHGSDTEIDDFAICQVVQLLPPPQSSPSREASRNFIASSQRQSSRGSWFLITGLPSFEYQTGGMSFCVVWKWRAQRSILECLKEWTVFLMEMEYNLVFGFLSHWKCWNPFLSSVY